MKKLFFSALIIAVSFTAEAQPTAGLMAYWPMNGNFNDAGPNAINGTNSGATATTNNQGAINTAMNFNNPTNAVPQFATHAPNANLSFGTSQDFSIDFSLYISGPYVHTTGYYDNNINYGGYGGWVWNSNGFLQLNFNCKNGNIGTTNGALALNTWYHICCLRSGSAIQIYINGVLNATGTVGTLAPVYSYNARFGSMFFTAYTPPEYNGHIGKLDEFRIYNRALTPAEILALSNLALPIKLSSFTAVNKNNAIAVNWQTQYEQNSSHFNVQRSTDGINFTTVARVAAAGNSNLVSSYSYNDALTAAMQNTATIFYRLECADKDGRLAYSHVVAIHIDKNDVQLFVSPNPARDVLQVQTGAGIAGKAALIITGITGGELYKNDVLLQQGSNNIPVNISLLPAGVYIVRLVNGNELYTKQFVKE